MSNVQVQIASDSELVMVRGFEERPYRVFPLAFDGRVVTVTGDDVSHAIGYRAKDVYLYEEQLFTTIEKEKSPAARRRLWERATAFVPDDLPRLA